VAASRRLAAIMFTDMVGFTASAQTNEADALKLLREQENLVRPLLKTHKGREIKSTGDGFLVEFDSALHAVQCALDIHQHLQERNAQPGCTPIQLRIGVHLGDVEERGADIFGDSVNLAARIEPLAEPGGICISEPVFGQVRNKIPNTFEKLEPKALKNVRFPMDLYRVVMPWTIKEPHTASSGPTRLAVLPFSNISPDPRDEYFADGLTEELISVLSQIRGLRVISRTSVNQYRGTSKPIAQIGSELGVESVLEGSVRKAGDQLRIRVQLIDVRTDEHRWSQSYDRRLENVFAIQAEVAEHTAEALKLELLKSDREAIQERPTANLAAYELYLRGIQAHRRALESVGSEGEAVKYFEAAIREDPGFSAAYSRLANVLLAIVAATRPGREVFPRARELVTKSLELGPNSSEAHTARGNLAMQADLDWARAEAEFQRAIALNPSSSTAHYWYGLLLVALQRFSEAKKQLQSAIELDPLWPDPRLGLVSAYQSTDDWESAVSLGEKTVESFGENSFARGSLAVSYVLAGRVEDALAAAQPLVGSSDLFSRLFRSVLFASLGKPEEARLLLRELEVASKPQYVGPDILAMLHALLGEKEKALEVLEQDDREGDRALWAVYLNPIFDSLRDDPRFVALLRSMRLPTSPPHRRMRTGQRNE
jgi:adenylate cyclase